MGKNISIFIESLDEGYILTENGKKMALAHSNSVEEYVLARVKKEIERFSHSGINNMRIGLSVEENCPTTT